MVMLSNATSEGTSRTHLVILSKGRIRQKAFLNMETLEWSNFIDADVVHNEACFAISCPKSQLVMVAAFGCQHLSTKCPIMPNSVDSLNACPLVCIQDGGPRYKMAIIIRNVPSSCFIRVVVSRLHLKDCIWFRHFYIQRNKKSIPFIQIFG